LKYAIISDIHANLEALQSVLEYIDNANADQVVCLGDVVGYNANPNECADVIRERNIPTICGNHDAVACGLDEPWGFNPVALAAAVWTREQLKAEHSQWLRELPDMLVFDHFIAAHGSPTDRDCYLFSWEDITPHLRSMEEHDRTLCFFGHTHSPGIFSEDGIYSVDDDSKFAVGTDKVFFINPGSVGQPRDGDPRAAFGMFDTEEGVYELVRVEYPVEQAANKLLDAGLPHFLAERLYLGR
jgi:predicted phosphodiesterase